ncbi:hypothetical protein R3X25_01350 [Lutibacter sp. TH_r2]|uniref:hypothetical protein n=1 Tax=Lutibacter sp. TH_r2 TaxID=3082083 RepID=UPI002953D815|nr:hypothetical protein [Lutibacter sp. TH_r2]MDV7185910.1 hypothetical protein [Lutibacter sp. TH_r2]
MKKINVLIALLAITAIGWAQETEINVNLQTKHIVGDIEDFDREKYITIHANIESDWSGNHVSADIRNEFLNTYDVYLGRETGGLKGALNRVKQDPNRPGFADASHLKKLGYNAIKSYKNKDLKQYDNRLNNMVIGSQFHPIWPEGSKTKQGWSLSQKDTKQEPFGKASGEYMAHYIKEFFSADKKRPKFIEVINEPMWDLVPRKNRGIAEKEIEAVQKMAKFHSTVAREIKKLNPDVLVGGFTCAFPDFEFYDFNRWNYRWKQFIDITGDDMDFWSLHFYDFPCKQKYEKGKLTYVKKYRKGSNIKATLDMLEQYSMLKFGKIKPLVISEYSVQAHRYRDLAWTPWRDFLYVKSANSMLMTFMDYSNSVAMAIPFFMLKSEWGRTKDGHPYRSRLFRQQFEKEGETGDKWVYTDLVHFYQLWSDVKGKRVDITSNNIDIQTDAYVKGNKAYVILNNLTEEKISLKLNVFNQRNNVLKRVKIKHHYAPYKPIEIEREGVVEEKTVKKINEIELEAEGTMVLEYFFKKTIKFSELKEETKYFSEEYLKPIEANKELIFNINNIEVADNSKAVLRIGIGRDHGKSLKPQVQLNGENISVPENYAGLPQTERDRFYGVLEIPIDTKLLKTNNKISVKFADNGGHLATVTMKVFNFKK